MKNKIALSLFLATMLVGCQVNEAKVINHMVDGEFINNDYFFPMNTVTQLKMFYQDQFDEVVDGFDLVVKSVSKEVDRYHDFSLINNLKTINDSCGSNEEIKVSQELFEAIKLAKELTVLTEGKFNLAMGNLIDLYSDKISEELSGSFNTLPDRKVIDEAIANIPNYREIDKVIELNEDNKTIKLNQYNGNNVIISLGAIAKGFVMQKAYDYLKQFEYPALFDAGSSTMGMIGEKPASDKNWNISLLSPTLEKKGEILVKTSLYKDHFISSSGDYNQYFFYNNDDGKQKLMHHIIDPYTGVSNNYIRSVTLISNTINMAILDALSTAIFNCYSDEEIINLIQKIEETFDGKIAFIINKPYYENDVIDYNKFNVVMSESFSSLVNGNLASSVKSKKVI